MKDRFLSNAGFPEAGSPAFSVKRGGHSGPS